MNIQKIQNFYFGLYDAGKKMMIGKYQRKMVGGWLKNPNILTAEQKQAAVDFWSPYVKLDSVFHAFYKEKSGVFRPEFLPKDVYLTKVDEFFNDRSASWYLDNKCLYTRLFPGIAQADNIMYRMGGFWYDANWRMISRDEAVKIAEKEDAVVTKAATRSVCGNGVQFVEGNQEEKAQQFTEVITKQEGDIVVQRPIKQHESFAALHSSSVNTLRLLTLLTEDGPKVYSVIVRMGGGGERIDNCIATGLFCGVNDDGSLKPVAYRLNGDQFKAHPTSGLVFEGHTLIGVEKAKELVMKAAPMLPLFRMVSWDIVVDESGEPLMLECNLAKGSIHYHQLTNGPVFGEDTKKVMDEVFGKKKG